MEDGPRQTQAKWYIWLFVAAQIFVIGVLLTHIVQPAIVTESYTPLAANTIYTHPSSTFAHYYEYRPGTNNIPSDDQVADREYDITINSDTIRSASEYTHKKPDRTFRVGLFGDSWTFGLFADENVIYSARLEEKLNQTGSCGGYDQFEVINFGVPGHDLQFSAERYRLRAVAYELDASLAFVTGHNLYRHIDLFQQKLIETQATSSDTDSYDSRKMVAKNAVEAVHPQHAIRDLQFRALESIIEQADEPVVIYLTPTIFNYEPGDVDTIVQHFNDSALVYVSDMTWSKEYVFADDNHPNHIGHQRLADDLYEYITTVVIDCAPR